MKILLINYRYFLSGGPEKYMFGIKQLLESHGHEVIPFSVRSSKDEKTEYRKYFADPIGGQDKVYFEDYKMDAKTIIQGLGRQFYSFSVKSQLERLIKDTKPDVCYLLHHYNKLSPSVIDACKKHNIPVVMRLSDFFLACPNALFVRDGGICEECSQKTLFSAVKHRCVKNSLPASLIKVAAMYFHRLISIYDKVSYIVVPSRFTMQKLDFLGYKDRFVNIPTFIKSDEAYNPALGDYALFVGRIEEEKGVMQAIRAVEGTDIRLKIVGKSSTAYSRKVEDYLKENKIGNVEFAGPKYGEDLMRMYQGSRCVIIPAQWYENMPNVALEAMAFGKPIIASDLGSLRELVRANYNGLLFDHTSTDDLKSKIQLLFSDDKLAEKFSRNAYLEAVSKYDPKTHYTKLIGILKKAVDNANHTANYMAYYNAAINGGDK